MDKLLILSVINDRSKHVIDLLLGQMLKIEYELIDDEEAFLAREGPKLAYATEPPPTDNCLFIREAGLISESGIRNQTPEPFFWKEVLCLFPVNHKQSVFPFDVFSSAFYLVSRYEEYLPGDKDEHNRYKPENSILFKQNVLDTPVVNQYVNMLRETIKVRYPELKVKKMPFRVISTIDVDVAFAYMGRSFARYWGSILHDLAKGRMRRILERGVVKNDPGKDPNNTFPYLNELHKQFKIPLIYFLLLSRGSKNDRNVHPFHPAYKTLVAGLDAHAKLGLHPSYRSNKDYQILKDEANSFQKLTGKEVKRSRQHYLKFELPDTYRNLIRCGIREDYSMGYAGQPGFRAGIAYPFPFYDLKSEQQTKLMIYPLTYMEGTLHSYLNLNPQEAIQRINRLTEQVKITGGYFISLWHNHAVNNRPPWQEWNKVFEHSLRECARHQQVMAESL